MVPAPTASSDRAPATSVGLTSSATPVNPSASPTITCPGGRAPRGRSQSASATQNGTIETSRAPIPEGTRCSAQLTSPLPPAAISRPMSAVVSQSRAVGRAAPRWAASATNTSPAPRKRPLAMRNGGISATPHRMAR